MSSQTLDKHDPPLLQAEEAKPRHSEFGSWRAPLLLIAAEVAVLGYLIRGSFFMADDYQTFGLAHVEGLSVKLLFTQNFGDLSPTERLLHLVLLWIAPMNYGFGEAVILALTAAMLVSLLWVLRELRVDPAVTLTLIFIVGSSTIVLNEVFDYDQVSFLFPASVGILCVMALFIRWIRTGSTRILIASWVVFALSFLTQERLLVVPIYLVVVRYLVLPYRMPPGGRKRPWADWRIWTPFAAIELAYYAYYRTFAAHASLGYGTIFTFYRVATALFLRAFIGLPLQGVPRWVAPIEWVAILAVLVAILAASRNRNRRRALLGAAAFFVVAFATNLFAVFHGLGAALGLNGVTGQLQYYLDAMLALAIAIGIAASPLPSSSAPLDGPIIRDPRERTAVSSRLPLLLACAVLVVVHVALLPFGMSNVLDSQGGQRYAASWVPSLRSSLASVDQTKRPITVLPLTMPAAFVPGFEAPFQLEQPFLELLPEWRNSDRGPVAIIGPTGDLQPARALDSVTLTGPQIVHQLQAPYLLSMHANSSGDLCFSSKVSGGEFRIVLPQAVSGDQIAVDIHLSSERQLTLTPFVGDSPPTVNSFPETVPPGEQRVVAALQATPANVVGFTGLNANAAFCVLGIQVAAVGVNSPVPDGPCRNVNVYGLPIGTSEPCGVRWR